MTDKTVNQYKSLLAQATDEELNALRTSKERVSPNLREALDTFDSSQVKITQFERGDVVDGTTVQRTKEIRQFTPPSPEKDVLEVGEAPVEDFFGEGVTFPSPEVLSPSEMKVSEVEAAILSERTGAPIEVVKEYFKSGNVEVLGEKLAQEGIAGRIDTVMADLQDMQHTFGLTPEQIKEEGIRLLAGAGLVTSDDETFTDPTGDTFVKVGPGTFQSPVTGTMVTPGAYQVSLEAAKWYKDQVSPEALEATIASPEARKELSQSLALEEYAVGYELTKLRAKAARKYKDRGVGQKTLDILAAFLPVWGNHLRAKGVGSEDTTLFLGEALEEVRKFKELPAMDQLARLKRVDQALDEGYDPLVLMEGLDRLKDTEAEELLAEGAWDLLLPVEAFPVMSKGYKVFREASVGRFGSLAGRRVVRSERLEELSARSDSLEGDEAEEYLGLFLTEFLQNDLLGEMDVGITHLNKLKEEAARALEVLQSKVSTRLTAEELSNVKAVESTLARMQAELRSSASVLSPKGVNPEVSLVLDEAEGMVAEGVTSDFATGQHVVKAYIGKENGKAKGFISQGAANKFAQEQLGIPEGFYEVEKLDGVFWLSVSRNLEEDGLITVGGSGLLNSETLANSVPFSEKLVGAKSIVDADFSGQADYARGLDEAYRQVTNRLFKFVQKIGAKKREDLSKILTRGRTREEWYSPEELGRLYRDKFGRDITEGELAAYQSYRTISDTNYAILNNETLTTLARQGYQEFALSDATGVILQRNGKLVDAAAIKNPQHFRFDMDDELVDIGAMDSTRLNALTEKGYKVVKLDRAADLGAGEVDYLLVSPKQGVNFRPLRQKQLNYVAGGPRSYSGRFFIKQANIKNNIKLHDKTVFNVGSHSEAVEYTRLYNEALDAFKRAKAAPTEENIARASVVISGNTRYSSFHDFNQAIVDGKINENPFELIESNGRTAHGSATAFKRDDEFLEYSDSAQTMLSSGRMYYSHRGDHLLHPKEGFAEVLDPFQAMQDQATHAAKQFAYGDFKFRQVERWLQDAGQDVISDGNPVTTALMGEIRPGTPSEKARRLRVSRQVLNQLLGTPTKDQQVMREVTENVAKFLDRKGAKKLAQRLDERALDPVAALRAINFHFLLGMGDISQLLVQTSMLPGVIAVGGKRGLQGLAAYPYIRRVMLNPRTLDVVAESQQKLTRIPPGDFKQMFKDIQNSGQLIVGDTQAQLDMYSNVAEIKSVWGSTRQAASKASRFFFNEAEMGNKGVAATIAWLEQGSALNTPDKVTKFAARAELLAGNMSRTGNAWWQSGITSLGTQMAAHPFRVAESMFVKQATGFTPMEKLRFAGGLTLVYGSAAIPFATTIFDMMEETGGVAPTKEEHAAVTRGMWGVMLPDVDITRLQPFGGENLIQKIGDPSTTAWELALGPTGNLMTNGMRAADGAKVLWKVLSGSPDLHQFDRDGKTVTPLTIVNDITGDLKNSVSSLRRGTQAYLAWATGEYMTASGFIDKDLDGVDAAFLLLGMPSMRSREAFEVGRDLRDRKELLNDVAKVMSRHLRQGMRAKTDEEMLEHFRAAHAYATLVNQGGETPNADGVEVFNLAMSRMGNQTYTEAQLIRAREVWGATADQNYKYLEREE
jgi:hypothetical protein